MDPHPTGATLPILLRETHPGTIVMADLGPFRRPAGAEAEAQGAYSPPWGSLSHKYNKLGLGPMDFDGIYIAHQNVHPRWAGAAHAPSTTTNKADATYAR